MAEETNQIKKLYEALKEKDYREVRSLLAAGVGLLSQLEIMREDGKQSKVPSVWPCIVNDDVPGILLCTRGLKCVQGREVFALLQSIYMNPVSTNAGVLLLTILREKLRDETFVSGMVRHYTAATRNNVICLLIQAGWHKELPFIGAKSLNPISIFRLFEEGEEGVITMLRAGADVKARDYDGMTILHFTALHAAERVLDELYYYHLSDLTPAVNTGNESAIHFLPHIPLTDKIARMLELLVGLGVDLNRDDNDGFTAVSHFVWNYAEEDPNEAQQEIMGRCMEVFRIAGGDFSVSVSDHIPETVTEFLERRGYPKWLSEK